MGIIDSLGSIASEGLSRRLQAKSVVIRYLFFCQGHGETVTEKESVLMHEMHDAWMHDKDM